MCCVLCHRPAALTLSSSPDPRSLAPLLQATLCTSTTMAVHCKEGRKLWVLVLLQKVKQEKEGNLCHQCLAGPTGACLNVSDRRKRLKLLVPDFWELHQSVPLSITKRWTRPERSLAYIKSPLAPCSPLSGRDQYAYRSSTAVPFTLSLC